MGRRGAEENTPYSPTPLLPTEELSTDDGTADPSLPVFHRSDGA